MCSYVTKAPLQFGVEILKVNTADLLVGCTGRIESEEEEAGFKALPGHPVP